MGQIRELPAEVINQIAAGEVVERPASVVKELLENAIDAAATRVELTVERGGKDLVRVADNGAGISRDDLPIAFRPHATSKLESARDLIQVRTLGFRGEALAAIAEVSRVRCQSRTVDDPIGAEISIEAGKATPLVDCGCPIGTVMEVRNLFFNTPVRRTFLKTDTTEAGHVAEIFTRIALAHPTVHLTYRSGSKIIHDLPPVTGIKERVGVFFGHELADSLLWVESEIDGIHLWGYVAHPSQSRSSSKGQYLFVGNRYVRDRSLGHALSEAYRGLLMVGRQPIAFLHLDLPSEEVDVNVHPTKIEVRFRDSQRIYRQLLSTVRQSFLNSDLHNRLQANAAADHPSMPSANHLESISASLQTTKVDPVKGPSSPDDRRQVASWFEPAVPPTNSATNFSTFDRSSEPEWAKALPAKLGSSGNTEFSEFGPDSLGDQTQSNAKSSSEEPFSESNSNVFESAAQPKTALELPTRAIQVHDTYLIAETDEGMVVIDQHALHERILFEELRMRIERGGVESQRLLVPEPVSISPSAKAAVLERREALNKVGVEITEEEGGVVVQSVPAMLGAISPARLLEDLADQLESQPLPLEPAQVLSDVISMIACKAAIKANQRLTLEEIDALLSRRHLVRDSHHCPHGRPTVLVFTKEELEKQFGRI